MRKAAGFHFALSSRTALKYYENELLTNLSVVAVIFCSDIHAIPSLVLTPSSFCVALKSNVCCFHYLL